MNIVEEKIARIKGRKYGGSSTKDGKLYHDVPFNEFKHCNRHRGGTQERVDNIANLIDVKDKTILDLGCSVGGIAFGMVQKGAREVVGIDYDIESIEVAKAIADLAKYDNIEFHSQEITLENIKKLPRFDVILWLSQWMWSVKQKGLEYGKELLYEVSKKADIMIFESASNDGMAKIKGSTQDDIEKWLKENTCYMRFARTPSTGGWMRRNVFVCTRPVYRIESTRQAASSIIERISRNKIKKIYRQYPKDCRWMQEREVRALKLLEKYDHYPRVLEVGEDYIVMNFIGRRLKRGFNKYKDQAWEILKEIKEIGLTHRDINRKNFLELNGKLHLIDFGWCVFEEENINKARTHRNLRQESDEEMIKEIFGL